ncbi:hypothetical protein BC826DRAFT_111129 [Russula brevipes]|nr:hypothetical protein BC826DRAFT_111129 [Russula brevipes]
MTKEREQTRTPSERRSDRARGPPANVQNLYPKVEIFPLQRLMLCVVRVGERRKENVGVPDDGSAARAVESGAEQECSTGEVVAASHLNGTPIVWTCENRASPTFSPAARGCEGVPDRTTPDACHRSLLRAPSGQDSGRGSRCTRRCDRCADTI